MTRHNKTMRLLDSGVLIRGLCAAGVWAVATGGDPASWIVGAPAAALAAWLSLVLRPQPAVRLSATGLIRFVPYFLWQSLRGGMAVAMLALRGRRHLEPLVCRIPSGLDTLPAREMALSTCSLLPGSLGADLDGQDYLVHALRGPEDAVIADMRDIERRVARVFVRVPDREGAS